ncbi:PEGA domain-containing protein [Thermococcus sp.]|uniref:PEGA domain-containing protein n=2 Tax=Thermococcus sp. TaxID=35749 RepID=UPI0026206D68|nr:PEGA domain-containing protein [Thermococcus sp.]
MKRPLLLVIVLILLLSLVPARVMPFEFNMDGLMKEAVVVGVEEVDGTVYALGIASSGGGSCDGYAVLLAISPNGTLEWWKVLARERFEGIDTDVEFWPYFEMVSDKGWLMVSGVECVENPWENKYDLQSWYFQWNEHGDYKEVSFSGIASGLTVLNGTPYVLITYPGRASHISIFTTFGRDLAAFLNLTLTDITTDGRFIYTAGLADDGLPVFLQLSPSGKVVKSLKFHFRPTGDTPVRVKLLEGEPVLLMCRSGTGSVIYPERGKAFSVRGFCPFDAEYINGTTFIVGVYDEEGAVLKIHDDVFTLTLNPAYSLTVISGEFVGGGGNGSFYVATLEDFLREGTTFHVIPKWVDPDIEPFKPVKGGVGYMGLIMDIKLLNPLGYVEIWPNPMNADVYINGNLVGDGPTKLTLLGGRYYLAIYAHNWTAYKYEGNLTVIPGKKRVLNLPLTWYRGWIIVNGTPRDAEVYVDGEYEGRIGDNITVDAGNHTITIKSDGYRTLSTNVTVPAFKTIYLNVTLDPVAVLYITSRVSNTKVYINGTFYGEIKYPNDELRIELPPGKYILTATREGYLNYTEELALTAPLVVLLEVRFKSAYGFLNVTTEPSGARVIVDGRDIGTTPLVISLLQGRHEVRILKEGYEPYSANITITAEEMKLLPLRLKPLRTTSPETAPRESPPMGAVLGVTLTMLAAGLIVLWRRRAP